MDYEEVFDKFDIFDGLDDEERRIISGFFVKESYKANDIIYDEAQEGGALYLLMKGKVRVCRRTKDSELLPYATVAEGETFGLMSFIDGSRHAAITIADKDVEVIKIQRVDFESMSLNDPVMAAKVYKRIGVHLCDIIRDMNKQYMDLSTYLFSKGR
ncbi:Cyclic nucleotide-binding domain protein [Candidatus Magnetobacterium bavaricum]|uniref:Cyclic nucleotide-binding domain protein n=1 Tax=Candidatus Magnetobacterium bavaricum TaxID=29290 RepID=A0A0F3GSS2_9BACT|nr:Cyclic nucleotide-binding domain protein [Candidatus Magnetobacterium bavaricum]